MASLIFNNKWYKTERDSIEVESERIVLAAAKIINAQKSKNVIQYWLLPIEWQHPICWCCMPVVAFNVANVSTTYRKIHCEKSCHWSMLSASCKTLVSDTTLLFGLGVELDHIFGSKWLINKLFHLWYSISCDAVTRFKQNFIISSSFEDVLLKYLSSVTQWVANNVNHNICALDGKNTFHGMGVIAVSTPFEQPQHTSQNLQIQRNKIMKVGIAAANKGIPIKWFEESSEPGLSAEKFKWLIKLQFLYMLPLSTRCDLLGILSKRCILEINCRVTGLASFKMYPSKQICLLLI